jgi:AcrR family transcriptional regulator
VPQPNTSSSQSPPEVVATSDDDVENLALADEQRLLVRSRLIRAARRACAVRGLDVRMEDVAKEARVSRRTAFRYFPNRSILIREAFVSGMDGYRSRVSYAAAKKDPAAWVEQVCITTHQLNAQVGKLFWDLTLAPPSEDPELARTVEIHHASRAEFLGRFATSAWKAFGGENSPPEWLADAIAVQLSAFTTEALRMGQDRSPADIGRATSAVIRLLIESALQSRDAGAPRPATEGPSDTRS